MVNPSEAKRWQTCHAEQNEGKGVRSTKTASDELGGWVRSPYQCDVRVFEETPKIIYASLVQLVERRSPKPDVEGSSPSGRDL